MTHQAPSTMQAWPTSMNVFLTTTFSVPFAQFGDMDEANSGCIKYLWFLMNELHHKHILKRRGLYSLLKTLVQFCCNAGIIHFAAEKDHNDTTAWTHPTFIQWQLQHGTRHVKCACHEALLPDRVISFYRGCFTTFKNGEAETKCSAAASAMMGIPSKRGFFRQSYTTVQTEKLLVISTPTVHGRCSTLTVCKPNLSSWITTLKIHDSIMPLNFSAW